MKTNFTPCVCNTRKSYFLANHWRNGQSIFQSFFIALFFSSSAHASIAGYSYSTTTGAALETGVFSNLLGTFLDDDVSALTNIGFTFNYNSVNYTQFTATSNGVLMLGGSAATDYNNAFSSFNGPYMLPYWDDNYTDADGNVRYLLTGAAGSRKLVIDYNLSYLGNTGTADKHFQIWLFETSNIIQFVYGAGTNLNGGFSLGILSNGTTDFQSVTTAGNTVSTGVANDNNLTWPGSGRSYIFNPVSGLPVNFSSFGYDCQENNIALNWKTASEVNCEAFEIQVSRDGYDYATIGLQNGNGTTPHSTFYSFTISSIYANQYIRLKQLDIDGNYDLYGPFIIPCDAERVTIYPNPTTEQTSITCPDSYGESVVSVYDSKGNMLSETHHNFGDSRMKLVDLKDYAAGIYSVKIITNKATTFHQIIKK
jgi:hypothetical protein